MAVIEFEHVSKSYRLGATQTSLREALPHMARKLFGRNNNQPDGRLFWALNDVTFKVESGEVLGIIGHNGAGKSTILKLLSKVSYPTSGHIRTVGRMAALIELGAGFHPDLSGRENVYLNGSILGLKRQEIDAQISNIVEFAGLEQFIDTPIKRYSSGMYVRLAFAVAAHVKADLLLVDEVLSVGDMAFQQKCMAKMNELRDNGTTIIFISHNLWSVETFCKRVLLMEAGQIEAEGDPLEVIDIYRRRERENLLARANGMNNGDSESQNGLSGHSDETIITEVELLNTAGQPQETFDANDQIHIRVHYVTSKRIESPVFLLRINRTDDLICCALHNWSEDNSTLQPIYGQGTFEACIGPLRLVPDAYSVEAIIGDAQYLTLFHATKSSNLFRIKGIVGDKYTGVFKPNIEWLPVRVVD